MNLSPNIIYLHGWGFAGSVFGLLEATDEKQCPCLYSLARDTGYAAIAEAIAGRCQQDTILVGWSMGGQLAIQAALLTDKVKGLVLIASAPLLVNRPGWDVCIDRNAYITLCHAFRHDPEKALKEVVSLTAYGDKDYQRSVTFLSAHAGAEANIGSLALLLEQMGNVDLRNELAELPIPVLMLAGTNDVLVKPAMFDRFSCPHIQTRLYTDSGHAPFINNASAIKSQIHDFGLSLL